MSIKMKVNGLVRLTRVNEFLAFVTVTTLLGAAAAHGEFTWSLVGVLVANWLVVGFAFMINDVEDAPDDALTPSKAVRNPVSAGHLSSRFATLASLFIAALSFVIYALLGGWTFFFGVICIVISYIYSWRRIRLKNIAVLDFLSHIFMLAGLQYLCGYFTFTSTLNDIWFYPLLMVGSISLYGELFNEMRDLEGDKKAGLRHTAIVFGPTITKWMMIISMTIGVISTVITFFFINIIAWWVIVLIIVIAAAMLLPPLIRMRRAKNAIQAQAPLHKPFEIAAALGLLVQFISPLALLMIK
ncbi:MAG TPA: UbiA family prenyltransferase [Anaerolineaceae bacterium]|nr:UbiA family prenyltransferase [Anaerolineaceae bacterium]HPN52674.1 UbiA family prenyltransferase [Anaerolineaceae bacterium]